MWIYSFEIPILMILGIILLFYFSRTRLPLRRNRVFLKLILIETVIILLDVSASVIDNDFREYPLICINIINMCYFIVFFMRAYVLYAFTVSVMIFDPEKSLFFRRLARIPMYLGIILAVLSMILGSRGYHNLIYYIDNDGYHSGAGYYVLYVVSFFYVILCFVASHLFYWNNRSGRREKYGMLLYNLLILSALIIRLLFPTVLIMDTMVFMAILVVFLAFINPEYYLDLRAFCFNSYALSEHIAENIGHLRMAPLGIVIRNFSEMRNIYGSEQMEEGLSLISMYFKELFPKGYVFYNRNGHFIILDDPQTDFEEKTRILSERFDRPWVSENTVLYLTAGFAIFEMAKDNHSSEALVSTLMRSLKKVDDLGSKETLYVTDDDIVKTEEENRVRRSIEDAIDGNGLELYLQPIYDAITGKLAGSEALSRIRDNEGNIIPPGIFIPVAESSGRINALGEMVFEKTCKFISERGLKKTRTEWINVNLSPSQFVRTDLAERYYSIAQKYRIDPSLVHLEITEGATIDDDFLRKQISALSEKGFKFVLDDYGTGYSNLERLKKCPFINVKLDMSLVWDYCKTPDAILPNMIQAFKHMGFDITAEGIEDGEMAETMKRIGCDYLQGYHFSKPVPVSEFVEKYSSQ